MGFPGGSDSKESACNVGDLGLIPGLGRSPGGGAWQPTPVFLPGEFHGQRNLAGYTFMGSQRVAINTFTYATLQEIDQIQIKFKDQRMVGEGTSSVHTQLR